MAEKKTRYPSWTEQEVRYLVDNLNTLNIKSIAYNLDRTIFAVEKKLGTLRKSGDINTSLSKGSPWTEAEDAVLRMAYPNTANISLGSLLPGRTMHSCVRRADKLNLKKDAAHMQKARQRCAMAGGLASKKSKDEKLSNAKLSTFYGDKVGAARVFLAEHRPRHLDKRVDKFTSPKVYVSGSTLQGF